MTAVPTPVQGEVTATVETGDTAPADTGSAAASQYTGTGGVRVLRSLFLKPLSLMFLMTVSMILQACQIQMRPLSQFSEPQSELVFRSLSDERMCSGTALENQSPSNQTQHPQVRMCMIKANQPRCGAEEELSDEEFLQLFSKPGNEVSSQGSSDELCIETLRSNAQCSSWWNNTRDESSGRASSDETYMMTLRNNKKPGT